MNPQKSYEKRRKNIVKRLNDQSKYNFWPEEMKIPQNYKSFYWAPDFSY